MPWPGFRLAGLITLTVALTGCASSEVDFYLARGIDLRQHTTYNWAPAPARSTGDPRLDNNPFFERRVRAAIDRQLENRGFEKADSPDLIVRYHANVTQELDNPGADYDPDCEECWPEAHDRAVLTIDLVDARTNRLAWRGWAKGSIEGVIDDQQWMEQRIDAAVARIMRELPR